MTTQTTTNISEVAFTSVIESRRVARQASLVTMTRRETMYRLALAAQVRHPHLVGHLERVDHLLAAPANELDFGKIIAGDKR